VSGILDRLGRIWGWARRKALAHLAIVLIGVPIILAALALAGYAWWWRVVADGVRQNALDLQVEQVALGRQLSWDSFKIEGFPYRVETTIAMPHYTAPDRGTNWDGERLVIHVQPLALNRAVISFEGLQHFLYGQDGRWIQADGRADKAFVTVASSAGKKSLAIDIARFTGKATIDAQDYNLIVEKAEAALSVSEGPSAQSFPRVDIAARIENVAVHGNIDSPLGRTIGVLKIDAGLQFQPDMASPSLASLFAAWRQADTPVDLRQLDLDWGGIQVSVSGNFKLDAQDLPEGRFTLKLGNHPRILDLLRTYDWITPETQSVAKPVLDTLAFFSGDPQRRITVPLTIEGGVVYLGPARVATLQPSPDEEPAIPEPAMP
jgi:hypothetical protein